MLTDLSASARRWWASSINNGRPVAFRPARSFEAVVRNVDGELVVYARYVGDGAEPRQ
jgi:hypothetical protein